jgi:hypothetical protein
VRAFRKQLIVLGGVGLLGAVVGHVVGYWLAHPDDHHRSEVLEASGHGYFDMAVAIALVAALVALFGQFALGYLERHRSHAASGVNARSAWVALALVQMTVFLVVEVAERMFGGGLLDVFQEPGVWLGLPVQALLAGVGALLISWARRSGASLAAPASNFSPPRSLQIRITPRHHSPALTSTPSTHPSRGPPVLSH